MNKKKSKRGLVAALCAAVIILSAGAVWFLRDVGRSDNPQQESIFQTASPSDEEMTEDLYYLSTNMENIAIDGESGIPYAGNELLLTSTGGVKKDDIEALAADYGGKVVGYIKAVGQYQVQFPDTYAYAELEALAGELAAQEQVASAGANLAFRLEPDATPAESYGTDTVITNDTEWIEEWEDSPGGLNWGVEAINAPGAWEYLEQIQQAGPIGIGVYDNQFYERHEDLAFSGTWKNNFSTDESSHGTHVAGTIAAGFNNGKGIAGVSPNNGNLLYGVSDIGLSEETLPGDDQKGYTTLMAYECAFSYLVVEKGCRVINVSMGCRDVVFAASRNNLEAIHYLALLNARFGDYLQTLLDIGYDFVICKSAGNLNLADNENGMVYFRIGEDDARVYDGGEYRFGYVPYTDDYAEFIERYDNDSARLDSGNVNAAYDLINGIKNPDVIDRVIVVGAIELTDTGYAVAGLSQTGARVDVLAPGVKIHSTVWNNGGSYDNVMDTDTNTLWSGTSMAVPHVTGVAAMVIGVNPDLTGPEAKAIICDTATGKYQSYVNGAEYIHPLVDAKAAVEKAMNYGKEFVTISTANYAGRYIFVKTSPRDIDVRTSKDDLVQTISAQEDFGSFVTNGTVIYYMITTGNTPSIWRADLKSGNHEELAVLSEDDMSEVMEDVNSWDAWDTHLKFGLSAGNDRYLYLSATWETYTYMSMLYSFDLETHEVLPGDSLGHLTETKGKVIFNDLQTSVQPGTLTIMDADGGNKVELRDVWSYQVIGDDLFYLEEQPVSGSKGNPSAVYLKKCDLNGENIQSVSGRLAVGFSFWFSSLGETDLYISYWSYDSSMDSALNGFIYNYDTGNQYTLEEFSRCAAYSTTQGKTYLYEAGSGNIYLFDNEARAVELLCQYSESVGACGNIFSAGNRTYLSWYHNNGGVSAKVIRIH